MATAWAHPLHNLGGASPPAFPIFKGQEGRADLWSLPEPTLCFCIRSRVILKQEEVSCFLDCSADTPRLRRTSHSPFAPFLELQKKDHNWQPQFLLGQAPRRSEVTPQLAQKKCKAALSAHGRMERLLALPSRARSAPTSSALPVHRVETRGSRIPSSWAGQGHCARSCSL